MFQVMLRANGGASVVVKTATGAGVDHLRSEGERLAAAAHPGVVELIDSCGDDTRWTLTTAHGGSTLESQLPLTEDESADVAASLAATLADLHARGVVHGRIDATHVLLPTRRRALLCGFGGSTQAAGKTQADDVAALGRLIAAMVAPTRSPRLARVAEVASVDPPSCRPSARQLVGILAGEARTAPGPARHMAHRRRRVPAMGLVVGVGVAVVLLQPPSPVQPTEIARSAADHGKRDGPVPTVVHDGVAYEVGDPGDVVGLVDWDCDGVRTPVVLRPATGEVFVFEGWADREVEVTARTVVEGGRQISRGDRCGPPLVRRGDGAEVELPLGPEGS